MADHTTKHQSSRREFVKKAAYVAPAILTLKAAPAFAKNRIQGQEAQGGTQGTHTQVVTALRPCARMGEGEGSSRGLSR